MMEIAIGNKTVASVDLDHGETAWRIDDAVFVLEYLKDKDQVVLGGDILTKELLHNYDNWYYNLDTDQNFQDNIQHSIQRGLDYITNYIARNGTAFYVVLVTQSQFGQKMLLWRQQTACERQRTVLRLEG